MSDATLLCAVALPEIFPVLEGQMVPIEEVPKLVQEGKLENAMAEDLERRYDQFRQEFTVVYRKTLTLSRELASEMSYLEQEAASVLVDGVIQELKEKYPGDKIAEYGLTALVVGGAGAAAAKAGLLKGLWKFLLAGWKLVIAAIVGLGALLKRIFFGEKQEENVPTS